MDITSMQGGRGMISVIEILPGMRGRIRPVRIVARDVPYYPNDSHWWSSDLLFKGGQLATSEEPPTGTGDVFSRRAPRVIWSPREIGGQDAKYISLRNRVPVDSKRFLRQFEGILQTVSGAVDQASRL